LLKSCIKYFILFLSLISCTLAIAQETAQRPKIGLVLSGGGAKGLAHIGILKAIDSAGLKIDYITGTSMGSIIGGLYAIGYSADSIEKIARKIDWDLLISNQSSLRTLTMVEKEEYSKYAVELPWANNRFRLPSGVFEGQELWLKLAELFAPATQIKDFSKFSIPFKCISTDIGNGEAVVLSNGEIVSAIRSSMAIPSVFTAIDYDGRKLVDGGVTRNFPVRDVKEMGADLVIGSNAAAGLLPSDKVLNALQILLQVAFFREAEDQINEVPLCNIYIPHGLEKYNMGSFNQSNEILELGLAEGRKLYPKLKHLVDSLDGIYGKQEIEKNRLPATNSGYISSYEIKGLKETTPEFFLNTMNFKNHHYYNAETLSNLIRKAFGTRYYSRIIYSIIPEGDGTNKIVFEVTENPLTFAKFGIHYNEFSGINVIANITSRNFFIPGSRDLVTINIGQNARIRAEHMQFLGRLKHFAFILGTGFDHFEFSSYNNFKPDGQFGQHGFNIESRFQYSVNRKLTAGIGTRIDWYRYDPSIPSYIDLEGRNRLTNTFAYFTHNSLDRNIFPKKGFKLELEYDFIYDQRPNLRVAFNGKELPDLDSAGISFDPYRRATFKFENYIPIGNRTVMDMRIQSGINFRYRQHIVNEFAIGGLTEQFPNQITFAGLKEAAMYSSGVATFQLGLRYELLNNTYVAARSNVLFNNFISKTNFMAIPNFLSGYALSFAYNFALGPLELSAMYCDQTRKVKTYINIGIPF
jgi:NTE family protein